MTQRCGSHLLMPGRWRRGVGNNSLSRLDMRRRTSIHKEKREGRWRRLDGTGRWRLFIYYIVRYYCCCWSIYYCFCCCCTGSTSAQAQTDVVLGLFNKNKHWNERRQLNESRVLRSLPLYLLLEPNDATRTVKQAQPPPLLSSQP